MIGRCLQRGIGAVALFGVLSRSALAGMPNVTLTDFARMRLDAISFFLLVLLLCAWGVKGLWNSFRTEFPKLPRISYRRALLLTTLWGLLFVIVLTMISGARELMTPGAWRKDGFTYALEEKELPPLKPPHDVATPTREDKLRLLGAELLRYAIRHEGRFPSERDARELIGAEFWQLPEMPATKYLYLENRNAEVDSLLAWEPAVFGDTPLGLFTSGEVRAVSRDEIQKAQRDDVEITGDSRTNSDKE
ncbi:hypothetical protein GC176_13895 [bacterium]|nr:hypothetical protein [bacterium]